MGYPRPELASNLRSRCLRVTFIAALAGVLAFGAASCTAAAPEDDGANDVSSLTVSDVNDAYYAASHNHPQGVSDGWNVDSDGFTRYYVNGEAQRGWVVAPSINGGEETHRYYLDPKTMSPKTGFFEVDGASYYATSTDKYVVVGKTRVGDGMLLSDSEGHLVTTLGWLDTDQFDGEVKRYYIDNSCDGHPGAHIGWFTVDGTWFHGSEEGYLSRNVVQQRDGVFYAIDENGACSVSTEYQDMQARVNNLESDTEWLIAYDVNECWLGIFTGSQGNWKLYNGWRISTGAEDSPSLEGEYTVGSRGYSFGKEYTCYYYTQIYGDWLFHSAMYEHGTFNNIDQGLGLHTTGGCVRMDIENAKWIYDNIPSGSKILGYSS